MNVRKLILSGYKRLFLNNIQHVEYTPESNIQMILGRNGCGKSSLLAELNPLPADIKRMYREDGYKIIEFEHHGKIYNLSSNFIDKGKHSFKMDNVELNTGGTRKAQLQLVLEHFNITPNVNDVLTGLTPFTGMSTVERKHWFSMLSTVDYEFSISVYNKLKQRHRDICGGIKLLQEELLKEEYISFSEDEAEVLKSNKKYLVEYLEYVISFYRHNADTDVGYKYTAYKKELLSMSDNLKSTLSKLDAGDITEMDIEALKLRYHTQEDRLNYLNDKTKEISKKLSDFDRLKTDKSFKELLDEKSKLLLEKESIVNDISRYFNDTAMSTDWLSRLHLHYINFCTCYSDLVARFIQLDDYKEVDASPKNRALIHDQKAELEKNLKITQTRLDQSKAEYETYKSFDTEDNLVTCENCNHTWNSRFNTKKLETLHQVYLGNDRRFTAVLDTLNDVSKTQTDIESKYQIYVSIMSLFTAYSDLKPIWKIFIEKTGDGFYSSSSTKFITLMDDLKSRLARWAKYNEIDTLLRENEIKLEHAKELDALEKTLNAKHIAELELELVGYTKDINTLVGAIKAIKNRLNLLVSLESQYTAFSTTLNNITRLRNSELLLTKNTILNEYITFIKSEIAAIDQKLILNQKAEERRAKNLSLIDGYKKKEMLLSLTLKELSPTEGIIAKSINSFLNLFLNEMNYVINSIWSYSMEILPCEITDTNDLDYKFKVKINNDEIIDEISLLSSSMQEIVNLAFKIMFMKYMRLSDFPLHLDEFGRTFDKAHRINAYNIIDKLLSSNFQQIFIVSHYEEQYLRFKNADISVLDSNNIDLSYNMTQNKVMVLG